MQSGKIILHHLPVFKVGIGARGEEGKEIFACVSMAILNVYFILQCFFVTAEKRKVKVV